MDINDQDPQNVGLVPQVTTPAVADDAPETYQEVEVKLKRLIRDWEPTRHLTEKNRKMRDLEVSTESMRTEGILDEDETFIPVRIIDVNITREQPPYINYLKNSRRLCIFTSVDNPDYDSSKLELDFTRGMTYLGWENQHYKAIDGSATHGWDTVEVVFDSGKPLHVGIEQVGHDQLFWPRSLKNIQQASNVIRAYDYSLIELKQFVKAYGWSGDQVNKIIQARKSHKNESETVRVYKRMFKVDGIVNVAWFSIENGCDDWLKIPAPLYLGIDSQTQTLDPMTMQPTMKWEPVPQTDYPYFILPYRESEKPKLIDKRGRCFLDGNKQEAQTAILSAFVNGLTRASNTLASPKVDDGSGNSVKEIANSPLGGGTILNKPVDFYNSPYPDPSVLVALQYMDTSNSNETNQLNFAVANREDSRKTAKEIGVAETQSNLLNSVQLTLFSSYIRGQYTLAWLIVQSQAMQNLIKFLLVNQQQPQMNPLTKQPVIGPDGQPVMNDNWTNDSQSISQTFDVRAAGDVDVIQRSELISQMKQDWPVVQNTPLASQFLEDLILLSYPQKGEQYVNILKSSQGNQIQQGTKLISAMNLVIQELVKANPEVVKSLPPDQQAQLGDIMNQAKQVASTAAQPNQKPK
jgi:hypothetical protein